LRITRWQLLTAAVVGTLLLFGGNGFVRWRSRRCRAGLTALLVSTTPLWLVVLGLLTGDRARRHPCRILVGFAGTASWPAPVVRRGGLVVHRLVLLATLCWASGSLWSRRRTGPPTLSSPAPIRCSSVEPVLTVVGLAHGGRRPARRLRRAGRRMVGPGLSRRRRQPGRVHRVLLAAGERAAPAGVDVRLRQPGRGRDPRVAPARRAGDDARRRRWHARPSPASSS
jgi:hypothetical protein